MKGDAMKPFISLSATAAINRALPPTERTALERRVAYCIAQFPARNDRAIVDNRTIASALSGEPREEARRLEERVSVLRQQDSS